MNLSENTEFIEDESFEKEFDNPEDVKEYELENKIRDVMDRPILRAAIYANADVILTGDKDFLEADISCPQILTAAEFLKL